MIAARGLTVTWSLGGEKIVLYTVWFAYSVVVVVFPSCLLKLPFSQPTSFPFCPFLLPVPLRGKGRGERVAV